MAKSRKRSAPTRRRGVGVEAARDRIAELRTVAVPIASGRENLDGPLDGGLRITEAFPKHPVALEVDGETVSQVWVCDLQQQIGSQVVRMGGIADVATHDDHRFRGYMRRVMSGALCWMRREGYDTSMLYGIRSFYPKFGYAPAFPRIEFTVSVRDAEAVRSVGYRFVAFRAEHLRAVLRMYHAHNAGRTGPVRRDAKSWQPFRKGRNWHSKAVCKVALDRTGRPAGYIVYDSEPLTASVIEVGAVRPAVFADILRAASRHAWQQRLEHIQLVLPEDDAFIEFCKPLGLRKKVHYLRDGEAMVRMINVPGALKKVAAELGSRMRGSGRLNLRTNLDSVGVAWSRGRLRVAEPMTGSPSARMPQWALAQLLYGYRSASGLAAVGVLRGARAALEALEEMFPPAPHFHHCVDYF